MLFRLNAITLTILTSVSAATFSPVTQADTASGFVPSRLSAGAFDERCYSDVPPVEETNYNDQTPIAVSADTLNAQRNGKAVYQGGVEVNQGNKSFKSDYTEFDQKTRDVKATGNIIYKDGQVTLKSQDSLTSNLDTKSSTINNATYQLHGSPARGEAGTIALDNEKKSVALNQVTFTTCPPGQESWWLKASEVNMNQDEVFGEAWNATVWLEGVPIFYTPYINFPIRDERKSGLLNPSFTNSSKNGFDVSTPYYWNIAPNYDLTFTPREMTKRGLMYKTEYRYMPDENFSGTFYSEYMNDDQIYEDRRWLTHLEQDVKYLNGDLDWNINYTKVDAEDYNYFNDLDSKIGQELVDSQLMQSSSVTYSQADWNFKTEVRSYQILVKNALAPHQLMPQMTYNQYFVNDGYDIAINSEMSNFQNNSEASKAYNGQRLHVEPSLNVPIFEAPGYYLNAESKLMATYYQQQTPDNYTSGLYYQKYGLTDIDGSASRVLPELRIHGGMTFDRQTSFNSQPFTQTLEPEVQYLYIPYKDQSHIGLYDTTSMQSDYYNLFSDRRFAGLDRISDANRISYGATTRLFDKDNTERVRFTAGQAYDFVRPKVRLTSTTTEDETSRSLLSVRLDTHPTDDWYTHSGLEYSTTFSKTSTANSAIEYQQEKFTGQVNYRYVAKENFVVQNTDDKDISQAGLLFSVPVNQDWQLISAHYRDTKTGKTADNLLGARYDSCCWAISMTYEMNKTPDNTTLEAKPETSYGLQFQFKGMGSVGKGKTSGLDTKLVPYTRPFNLND